MILQPERAAAELAAERLDAGVHGAVPLQVVLVAEALVAGRAGELGVGAVRGGAVGRGRQRVGAVQLHLTLEPLLTAVLGHLGSSGSAAPAPAVSLLPRLALHRSHPLGR